MSRLFTIFFLSLTLHTNAQTYALDSSFGAAGVAVTTTDIVPNAVAFHDNQYLFLGESGNTFSRINYDGSPDNTFGINGFKTIENTGQTLDLKGFKLYDGTPYIFGETTVSSNDNAFITKMSSNGNPDSDFGTGGKIAVDLGQNETFRDIYFNADGSFFAIGTQTYPDFTHRAFVCKFHADGTPDTSFNGTGTKFFTINQKEQGVKILPAGNNLFLSGLTAPGHFAYLIKIDQNGNLVTDFGNAGILTFNLEDYTSTLTDVQIYNNEVFFSYFWATSFTAQGQRLKKFNLVSPTPLFSLPMPHTYPYFKVLPDGKFLATGADRCVTNNCLRDYMIKRFLNDGTLDYSFNSTAGFNYDFGNFAYKDDASSIFYLHDDGKILMAGTSQTPGFNYHFAMIRLQGSTLGTNDFNVTNAFAVFPNPTTDRLFIQTPFSNTIQSIKVFDMTGKLMVEEHNNREFVDTAQLQRGVYMVQILTNQQTIQLKFLKS